MCNNSSETNDIFITHNWGLDSHGRDNHVRCKMLAYELIARGYTVWFDEKDMVKNIDNKIIEGINNSKVVLLCLTEKYCDKISNGINNQIINDNCYKEWNITLIKSKKIIPIIMENNLLNNKSSEIIQMYINSIFYIDMNECIYDNMELLCKNLNAYQVFSKKEKTAGQTILNYLKCFFKK